MTTYFVCSVCQSSYTVRVDACFNAEDPQHQAVEPTVPPPAETVTTDEGGSGGTAPEDTVGGGIG
ncbi:hypothetical protein [Streptomyces sp. NPDC050507]|uniref:hypothetical protein n=1 Tax=Streptomyces sp. NPDC050507 TaxID=3365619 RepID=UPI0037A7594E